MTKRIVIEEDQDGIQLPTSTDLLDLKDALVSVCDVMRDEANRTGRKTAWEAWRALTDSLYDIHAAAGWVYQGECLQQSRARHPSRKKGALPPPPPNGVPS